MLPTIFTERLILRNISLEDANKKLLDTVASRNF